MAEDRIMTEMAATHVYLASHEEKLRISRSLWRQAEGCEDPILVDAKTGERVGPVLLMDSLARERRQRIEADDRRLDAIYAKNPYGTNRAARRKMASEIGKGK
jgi:hypothetical protein